MIVGIVGALLIKIVLLTSLTSSVFYYLNFRKGQSNHLSIARLSYHASVLSLAAAAAILLGLIVTHQFQFTYVWNYSSTDLPLSLLISTFYAGQEGSFMLWALFTAIIGAFLLRYAGRKQYEAEVMSVYGMIVSFLALMLVVKDPFMFIWDSFPADLIQSGPIPPGITNVVILDAAQNLWARYPVEGKGLNPLLQNYWMVIHPQILFVGFSAMAVPYAHAIAGLMKRDYHSWIRVATPWLAFGAMMLGTGIILGGYWAYETLGWGGFWGWDPVENSSLVPWLICVAALHTTLVQRKSGAFMKTNFVLSILTFIAVLYSTFLTRSGVLGETSVHSFVDPGMWVYWLLMGWMVLFASLGTVLLLVRLKDMPKHIVQHSIFSREFALFLGSFALVFVALFVTIGTSSPIVTAILKGRASAVEMSYYVTTNLPLGVAIAFLSGLGQLLWWKNSKTGSLLKAMALPSILAVLVTIGVLFFGTEEILILLFTFCSAFSLFANIKVGYGIYRGNPKFVGGSLAHVGLAILFLGFVTSERYDSQKTLSLELGKPVEALGYTMTYVGYRSIDRDKYAFVVEVERDGRKHHVAPTMYYSEFTRGLMRHPDVINFISKDFYVAPLALQEPSDQSEEVVTLIKGKSTQVGELTLTFDEFDFGENAREAMLEGKEFTLRAFVKIAGGPESRVERIALAMRGTGMGAPEFIPATYETRDGQSVELALRRITPSDDDPSISSISVVVKAPLSDDEQKGEMLVVEASIKPLINLVWVGTVTLVLGFFLTILRRAAEARSREQWQTEE